MKRFFFVILCFQLNVLSAQVSISFPTNRAVFQRDNSNNGFIPIAGNFIGDADRIEARLVPVKSGQGSQTDWQLIQASPKAGYFFGKVFGKGGWYILELRTLLNNVVRNSVILDRVGIGEVILIGGQSNAQGKSFLNNPKPSLDERVNKVEFFNEKDNFDLFNVLPFAGIGSEGTIAPGGSTSWCWGELGDLLVKKLNVPVAFFNGAWGGIEYYKWTDSIKGLSVANVFGTLPAGQPYANMKFMGQFYGSLYGARVMLWCQGEGQVANFPAGYSADVYATSIQSVFDKFRSDIGKNLPIMVSRTSFSENIFPNQRTIDGQNKLITKIGNNVFAGPITDTISAKRFDGTHFDNTIGGDQGLTRLAGAWNNAMDNAFFQNSVPFSPNPIIPINEVVCRDGFNPVLKISSDYSYQRWSDGTKAAELNAPIGTYSAILRDRNGNTFVTPRINTQNVRATSVPSVSSVGATAFCEGGNIAITAAGSYSKFRWNTDDTTKVLSVKKGGEYSVVGVNQYGCFSPESNAVKVTVFPLPAKPVITANGPNFFCKGGEVTISGPAASKYDWSSGANGQSITFKQAGSVSLKITNQNGCVSPLSDVYSVTVKDNPTPPSIQPVGTFTLEATVPLDAQAADVFTWFKDGVALAQKNILLKATQTGIYTSQLSRNYTIPNTTQKITCSSPISAGINYTVSTAFDRDFSVYPNPIPVNGKIWIESKADLQEATVTLYTVLGQQVYSLYLPLLVTRQQLDLSNISRGFYILKIKTTNFEATRRLIFE